MAFRSILCVFVCLSAVLCLGEGLGAGLGAVEQVNGDNKDIQRVLKIATTRLNAQSNNEYRYMAYEVLDATKQVVSGMQYCVVAEIGFSECRNDEEHAQSTLKECPVKQKEMECRFIIWEQVWLNKMKILQRDCEEEKHLQCPGQRWNRDVSDDPNDFPELPGENEEEAIRLAFNEFVEKYKKPYESDEIEYENRYKIFKDNIEAARKMQRSERGTAGYGISQFMDLTREEFRRNYTMNGWRDALYELKDAEIPNVKIPDSFDWRDHDAVSEVKNQGTCGSCWAFSTTGNIEGQWAIKKKILLSLSEQELVDCDKVDQGCNGGLPSTAYKQIIQLGGLENETDYPYKGLDGKCKFEKKDVTVYINGSLKISSNEDDMAAWLVKNGPISIGINAMAMQFYLGGVAHPWEIFCNPKDLDHGVLIVGYGVKKGIFGSTPYWIIKNSWGKSWGEQGYYLIYRGDGSCGLNTMCTSATVD